MKDIREIYRRATVGAAVAALVSAASACNAQKAPAATTTSTTASAHTTATPAGAHDMTYQKPNDSTLKRELTPMQYEVTQHDATEPPFHNEYWNNHEPGIYVDIVTGEPLFSSTDKFESGTGWPSFTKPLEPINVREKTDTTLFMTRTEVRSAHGNSHLGHVFDDGPAPTGLRYCINSAALRFIPVSKLEAEGYGQYLPLFKAAKATR